MTTVTFTKLFSSITESTIWCEDDHTRLVWITMLAMANKNGFVFGSAPGLANRARVPVEAVRIALHKFQQPDTDSRTKDHEGRRIEEVDGGWRLLNYAKHRAIRDEEERKEYMKNLMRDKRAVSKVSRSKPPLAQAEAEAEAEAEATKSELMTENYFTEVEKHFGQRRGTVFTMSPRDFSLVEIWKDAGIPLEAVLRGIDASFDEYHRIPRTGRINSVRYCEQAVLAACEEMKRI